MYGLGCSSGPSVLVLSGEASGSFSIKQTQSPNLFPAEPQGTTQSPGETRSSFSCSSHISHHPQKVQDAKVEQAREGRGQQRGQFSLVYFKRTKNQPSNSVQNMVLECSDPGSASLFPSPKPKVSLNLSKTGQPRSQTEKANKFWRKKKN